MKVLNEWFVEVEWGKVAVISWGNPRGQPVLCVHGRQDSAATFLPLLELLPEDYYYVGFDMPGHGRSDTLPIGMPLSRSFGIYVIDKIIRHLGWTKFIYIGHSMGGGQGLFYNAIYPGNITKMILLDTDPALYYLVIEDFTDFYSVYDDFYTNYAKYNTDDRVYTKTGALNAVMRARGMTEEQAEVILSRNLKKIGEDQYKLLWDRRMKNLAPMNYSPDYCYKLFSKNCPPTLYIIANRSFAGYHSKEKVIVDELITKLERNVKNFTVLKVDGTHDVHFIHPERISDHVCRFLERDEVKSKL
ncbi:serine hydrolase-like protein [Vanessa cardui]|uniref:serine hydrolase-like protein n=1 Tax=Vanessa cardui TaxID=171605 RepID=UPI001F1402B2|nr:serine hydrolase-like protein [Vanessa cardui]